MEKGIGRGILTEALLRHSWHVLLVYWEQAVGRKKHILSPGPALKYPRSSG